MGIVQENENRKLIVSFTSFPPRISGVSAMLETIYAQTLPADMVLLWLAKEQFPEGEELLPEELLHYVREGKLKIRWCDDLKSHKKYFYVMQEYPEDLIVTVDDDLRFQPDVLQKLYDSYRKYPHAVSAMRAHLVTFSEDGNVLPYKCWPKEMDVCQEPSMDLFATSGAGTLFPPGILPPITFDREAIRRLCPNADDLWLKTMQLVNDVPLVLASEDVGLRYVPGSQEVALYNTNKSENDVQLRNIIGWSMEQFGYDIWKEKMIVPKTGIDLSNSASVFTAIDDQRKKQKQKYKKVTADLQKVRKDKTETVSKLKQTSREKSELDAKLQQANKEKSKVNEKLLRANQENSDVNAKLKQVHQEKKDCEAENKKLHEEITQLRENAASAKEQLEQKENEIAEQKEREAIAQRTIQEQNEMIWKLNARNQQLECSRNVLLDSYHKVKDELTNEKQEKKKLEEEKKEKEGHFLVRLDKKLNGGRTH